MPSVQDAIVWLAQARSDARTAVAVSRGASPMAAGDVGCHVALLCAQSFEKCIKGTMLLVGQTPTLTHEVEKTIDSMLSLASLRTKDPRSGLRALFHARGTRGTVKQLLSWTPGAAKGADPNYEYPWRPRAAGDLEMPYGHALFEDAAAYTSWAETARRLSDGITKIAEAVARAG